MDTKKKFIFIVLSVAVISMGLLVFFSIKSKPTYEEFTEEKSPTVYNIAADYSDYVDIVKDTSSKIPEEVEKMCLSIASSYGLDSYNIVDISEDKEDDTIFYTVRFDNNKQWYLYQTISSGELFSLEDINYSP